jgi:uncharacterized SAM-binding protein YcdF (DUF218 family)
MFFVLSKILGFFALPSNLLASLGVVCTALLFTRFARVGRCLLVVWVAALLLIGMLPVGSALINVLENRFPPWEASRGSGNINGIVVLGGAIDPDMSVIHHETALNDSAERLTSIAALARRYPAARIVYSGGSGSVWSAGAIEADYAIPLLESFGIERDRIVLEGRSRNTAENAVFSRQLVDPKPGDRWLLVTSAYHMPRAIGAFRKAGFAVEAYPVDFRTEDMGHVLTSVNTLAGGLGVTDLAMHEWAGLFVYWITGRSSELFPGP